MPTKILSIRVETFLKNGGQKFFFTSPLGFLEIGFPGYLLSKNVEKVSKVTDFGLSQGNQFPKNQGVK
jgi:hypothetical protein